MRGLFLRNGYAVDQAMRTLGVDVPPPTLVRHWKELTIIKKEQTARET